MGLKGAQLQGSSWAFSHRGFQNTSFQENPTQLCTCCDLFLVFGMPLATKCRLLMHRKLLLGSAVANAVKCCLCAHCAAALQQQPCSALSGSLKTCSPTLSSLPRACSSTHSGPPGVHSPTCSCLPRMRNPVHFAPPECATQCALAESLRALCTHGFAFKVFGCMQCVPLTARQHGL